MPDGKAIWEDANFLCVSLLAPLRKDGSLGILHDPPPPQKKKNKKKKNNNNNLNKITKLERKN